MGAEQQSPIHLHSDFQVQVSEDFLERHWPCSMTGVIVREKDHGVKIAFQVDKNVYVRLRGKNYLLKSFHFHHLSEHWLEGEPTTMEVHIVHQNPEDASYCVFGVFLEIDDSKRHKAFSAFASKAKKAKPVAYLETDPNEWLPADLSRFYYYEGSLTTDPYTESVSWIIFRQKLGISSKTMHDVIGEQAQDARDLQPLNRRIVLDCIQAQPRAARAKPSKPASKD